MVILLPNKLDGLNTLEKRLASSGLLQLLDTRMRRIRLDVVIPKFEMDSSFKLANALKKMGVTDLFEQTLRPFLELRVSTCPMLFIAPSSEWTKKELLLLLLQVLHSRC